MNVPTRDARDDATQAPPVRLVRRIAKWVAIAIVSLPLLYVLGIGPALTMNKPDSETRWRMIVLYAPLLNHTQGTPFDKPLGTYVNFWYSIARQCGFREPADGTP